MCLPHTVSLLLLSLVCRSCAELISTSVAVGGALGTVGILSGFNYVKCRFYECCDDRWIVNDFEGMKRNLTESVYGQHLAVDTITRAIRAHVRNPQPEKALVLSLHGWTGGGKNYIASIVAHHLYKRGMQSQFVHFFHCSTLYSDISLVEEYRRELDHAIRTNVSACGTSLFIFDELDKMTPGALDAIKPYLEYHRGPLHAVDYRRAIFMFLSNTGGNDITQRALEHFQAGKRREDLALREMEELASTAAYNEQGGLRLSDLISRHIIDHFIPFLPLEREHVKMCVRDYMRRHWYVRATAQSPSEDDVLAVADELSYFPANARIYSSSGCKRVAQKVEILLEKKMEREREAELRRRTDL